MDRERRAKERRAASEWRHCSRRRWGENGRFCKVGIIGWANDRPEEHKPHEKGIRFVGNRLPSQLIADSRKRRRILQLFELVVVVVV
jgi:hypothetical protein